VQLDADTKATGHGSQLVTFDPRPEPEVEHDAQAEAQDLSGELSQLVFHLLLDRRVPRGGERPQPLILGETNRAPVRGELPRECGLAGPGQPAGEDQSGVAYAVQTRRLRFSGATRLPVRP
jgi:hypothetical protein